MDFEHAAQRLKRDQSKLKIRRGRPEVSAKAKLQVERTKLEQQRLAAERQRQKKQEEFIEQYYRQCERTLGVKKLSRASGHLQLKATSIHGDGDKIALPPSVLEFLTSSGNDMATGSPWIFRIGIRNPDYNFPASPLLQSMQVPSDDDENTDIMDGDDTDEEQDNGEKEADAKKPYLDELNHRYLSYTHGTVVEFTQDEDHIGLPEPIAKALLRSRNPDTIIPSRRTVDPAKVSVDENGEHAMDVDDEKTPGHLAYGAFDVPDLLIEVMLVEIPKGKSCKLVPTPEAIKNGFYNLKDVKLVLEQSLIRTRATLSVGDVVHSWHRGTKYDLKVTEVTPSTYQSVTCINTDIEVEFGAPESPDGTVAQTSQSSKTGGYTLGSSSSTPPASPSTGYKLGSVSGSPTPPTTTNASLNASSRVELRNEPPETQTENICTVLIRADKGNGRRRFDVQQANLYDLYAFAATIDGVSADLSSFQLVTRFPRRVLRLTDTVTSNTTLEQVGLQKGQELFMVEKLN